MISISDHLEELAALKGDEQRIRAWLAERGLEQYPSKQAPRCPALRVGEVECDGALHFAAVGCAPGRSYPDPRRCGLARYRVARAKLAERLAACGYGLDMDANAVDISAQLLAGLDARRPVEGLADMVAVTREACAAPLRANTAFTGTCGTAKTQCLMAILFAALKQGVDAVFVSMAELRELAQQLDSYDAFAKAAAQTRRAGFARRELLVLDDLADREAGRPSTEGVLLDILAGGAVTAFSSNLPSDKLKEHPDVSHRVVSRLYSDRKGEPVRGQYVKGPDQRQHELRQQLKLVEGGKR